MELIHTCSRVNDLERSVAFYETLGFEELRRKPIRDEPEKPPYQVSEGGSRLCFVRDPDGYRVELIGGSY